MYACWFFNMPKLDWVAGGGGGEAQWKTVKDDCEVGGVNQGIGSEMTLHSFLLWLLCIPSRGPWAVVISRASSRNFYQAIACPPLQGQIPGSGMRRACVQRVCRANLGGLVATDTRFGSIDRRY